jgi:DNA repair protein RAD16
VKEEDFYQALYTQSQAQFNTYVNHGTVLNNYAHIFDILIRLRQAVDHPYLVIHSDTQRDKGADALKLAASNAAIRVKTEIMADGKMGGIIRIYIYIYVYIYVYIYIYIYIYMYIYT